MAAGQPQVVVAFAQALTELVTVEKKNIVLLTEIARDALRTDPAAAPGLAALISTRILQAAPSQKLPALYLLDSISKLVGEPYKTLFAATLPEAFMSAWQAGGPGLHRPLDKLLGTWTGVYPQALLADIQGRVAVARAGAAAAAVQPPPGGFVAGGGGFGFAPTAPVAPMVADPRLAPQQQQFQQEQQQQTAFGAAPQPYTQASAYPQQPMQGMGGFAAPMQQQQQPMQPAYYQQPQAVQQPAAGLQQVNVPDLLSSLMDAGLLTAPGAAQPAAPLLSHSTPPYASAATATPEREQPASTKLTPDRIKEHNPSALARLLRTTEATKSRFLDRKFLRRQQKAAGASARGSRFWYLDLDTWQASTTGAAAPSGGAAGAGAAAAGAGGRGAQQAAAAAAALEQQSHSVPVDDFQTHCALSGEPFEQFWDEAHQEWRYRGAKALGAEEAASYGLEEGALVLVSALGKPAASLLQHAADLGGGTGGGVVAQLQAQHEIAADLAAATAAAGGAAAGGAAGDVKADVKPDVKPEVPPEQAAGAAGGPESAAGEGASLEPQEKRQRVA
ncbi:ENTH VHS [Chlorella sorokiniana]|uniref:ENTH VHS n=1 Tax=Chlorella sorokiniana TaxID=3076 RepID=A0A2P6TTZ7_CHLSO|nr:ENTH VHS [Chlorella sorokiniana]|eukprot:PRW57523.1 ENTH VHS [Chlorella sorokiniana]